MKVLQGFKFFDKCTTPSESNILNNSYGGSELSIQVDGTATSFEIVVSGKVNVEESEYHPIGVVALKDFSSYETVSDYGMFVVSLDGVSHIKMEITSVTGGYVTCFGKICD